jgi:hypothetical protein
MSAGELIGVVHEAQPERLTVEAREITRWPRRATVDAPRHGQSPAVILLPMRAEVAAALVEARRLGKRFYLVTRD